MSSCCICFYTSLNDIWPQQLRSGRLDVASRYKKPAGLHAELKDLKTDATSGDETDTGRGQVGGQARYKIVGLTWRAPELTNLLRVLDVLHLAGRVTESGRPTRGNMPHTRPRHCYDPNWLKHKRADVLSRLRMTDDGREPDEVFDIPETIEEYVTLLARHGST